MVLPPSPALTRTPLPQAGEGLGELGASDLFLTAETVPHIKVDGVPRPADMPVLEPGESKQLVYELMNQQQREAFEETKESNFALALDGIARFRVNAYYQRGEVSAVIRLIKSPIPTFAELGLPVQAEQLSLLKRGLVLMVGAAGSGKSTTMAAMVGYRA